MFVITQDETRFEGRIYSSNQPDLAPNFDAMLADAGYDIRQIQFVEGLLFASMIPLHTDRPQRQKMMFCRALELLNAVFAERSQHTCTTDESVPRDQVS